MEDEDLSGGESDWIEVQSPSSANKAHWYNEENTMVINDSFLSTDCAVFPPINHEDLPIIPPNKDQLIEGQPQLHPSCSSASSPSDGDYKGEGEEAKDENKAGSWIRTRLEIFSSGIEKIASRMANRAVCRAGIWLFASATTGMGAMVLAVVLYRRAKRWQRQVQSENKQHLILLIKEKDQVHHNEPFL